MPNINFFLWHVWFTHTFWIEKCYYVSSLSQNTILNWQNRADQAGSESKVPSSKPEDPSLHIIGCSDFPKSYKKLRHHTSHTFLICFECLFSHVDMESCKIRGWEQSFLSHIELEFAKGLPFFSRSSMSKWNEWNDKCWLCVIPN